MVNFTQLKLQQHLISKSHVISNAVRYIGHVGYQAVGTS